MKAAIKAKLKAIIGREDEILRFGVDRIPGSLLTLDEALARGVITAQTADEARANAGPKPEPGVHNEYLEGWACSTHGLVQLELLLDGECVYREACDHPRYDVYRSHAQHPFSFASGFRIQFPLQALSGVGPDRVKLIVRGVQSSAEVWGWAGGTPHTDEDKQVAALRRYFEQLTRVAPCGTGGKRTGAVHVSIFVDSDGDLPSLRKTLLELPRIEAEIEAERGEISDIHVRLSTGTYTHAETSAWLAKSGIATGRLRFTEGGNLRAAQLAAEDSLLLYANTRAGLCGVSFSQLLQAYRTNSPMLLVQPAVYGPENLPCAGRRHIADLQKSVASVFLPCRSAGPVWLASGAFLKLAASWLRSESFELPPQDGPFVYHADLGNGVYFERRPEKCCTEQGALSTFQLLMLNQEFSEAAQGARDICYLVLPGAWETRTQEIGWQYQVRCFARELEEQGNRVVWIQEDCDGSQSLGREVYSPPLIDGYALLPLSAVARHARYFSPGQIIAARWDALKAANVLAYLTGSEVACLIHENADRRFKDFEYDRFEAAALALNGEFLPVFTAQELAQEFCAQRPECEEYLLCNCRINDMVFGRLPQKRIKRGICVLLGGAAAQPALAEEALALLRSLTKGLSGVPLTLLSFDDNPVLPEELAALAERKHLCADGPTAALVFAESALVIDTRRHFGPDTFAFEALRCGAFPLILDDHAVGAPARALAKNHPVAGLPEFIKGLLSSDETAAAECSALRLEMEGRDAPMLPRGALQQLRAAARTRVRRLESLRGKPRKISAVIPVYNALDALVMCVRSVLKTLPGDAELILVNDASDEGTSAWLRGLPSVDDRIRLVELEVNSGFVAACRAGVSAAKAENDIVLLNSDIVVSEGSFEAVQKAAYCRHNIGAVSPLSTASPHFEIQLEPGDDLFAAAELLAKEGAPQHPTVITPEGQFLYLRRWALERFGFFDPVYGRGFCEESDLCMRYFLHGIDLAAADTTLIHHRRSASFSEAGRNLHYNRNRPVFEGRWGYYYDMLYPEFRRRDPLADVRALYSRLRPARTAAQPCTELEPLLDDMEAAAARAVTRRVTIPVLADAEIVFVLPKVLVGGGSLSVLQHANELLQRGIAARVVSLGDVEVDTYPLLAPVIKVSLEEFYGLDWSTQRAVATFWLTAHCVRELCRRHPGVRGYYYVQDYEPWFYSKPERFRAVAEAEKSYGLGLTHVAKTEFLRNILQEKHAAEAAVITPGLDRSIFYPGRQDLHAGAPRVAALFRGATARRGAREMLPLLQSLRERVPELEVHLFGDTAGFPAELMSPRVTLHGKLAQHHVAALYRTSDIVLDLSYWHGFGRMGIEGMACGAVPVLTRAGGVEQYAVDGENSVLVAVGDHRETVRRFVELVRNRELRMSMRRRGIERLQNTSEQRATDDWLALFGEEKRGQLQPAERALFEIAPLASYGRGAADLRRVV